MNVAITGASGLVGRRLSALLTAEGHEVRALGRHAVPGVRHFGWNPEDGEPSLGALGGVDCVIHLAGENVAQRWTEHSRRRILESRVLGTRRLVSALGRLSPRPAALVCASAIGYYGSRGDEILTEDAPPGTGFLPEVCIAWEREAQAAEALGIRVTRVRIGIVLDSKGGALARMLPPFRLGLGGALGDGRQWMSWIHRDDLAGILKEAAGKPFSGAANAVAPYPVTNSDFTRELARALRRPAMLPVPPFALRALFGEMSEVLLGSQRASPAAAVSAGYRFRFPQLGPALADLLG